MTSTPGPNPSDEGNLKFLIEVMKNAKTFEPDFAAVATAQGINTAHNAQRRFKSIVEKAGYDCIKNVITDKSTIPSTPPTATAAANPQTPATPIKKTPASKKRTATSAKKKTPKRQKVLAKTDEDIKTEPADDDDGAELGETGDLED